MASQHAKLPKMLNMLCGTSPHHRLWVVAAELTGQSHVTLNWWTFVGINASFTVQIVSRSGYRKDQKQIAFDLGTFPYYYVLAPGYIGQYLKGISCQYTAQLSKRTGQKTLKTPNTHREETIHWMRGLQICPLVWVNRTEGSRQKKI